MRNYEGIMFSLPLKISSISVFDYPFFQRLLQSLCSRANSCTVFQEYTKFEGEYLFDTFRSALSRLQILYVRHILDISGKVSFFDMFLRRCEFEMLFPLTPKILGLQHSSGTDHCELENHQIYIYIYIYIDVPLLYI